MKPARVPIAQSNLFCELDAHAKRKVACLVVLAALCAGPGAALAGKCAGTNINNLVLWDRTEITKGTTLATWRGTSVTVADDANASYQLVSGECVGSFLTNPDGKTQAAVGLRIQGR